MRGPAYTGPPIGPSLGRRELALRRSTLFLGQLREPLTLAGVLALAGIGRALASALALAGIAGHALALGGVRRRRHRRHHRTGEEQGGGGSGERRTGLGIQLHDDLLDDCLKTKVTS